MAEMRILYQDPALVLAEKPVGMLSEECAGEETVISRLREQLGGYIGSVHRLDRMTGGVMVFSRDPAITGKLSEAIRERAFTKEYLVVTEGVPSEHEGVLEDYLFHDRRKNKVFPVKGERKGAKFASLAYRVLDIAETERGPRALLRVTLHTGRTHQIRVQLASRKLPLTGDGKYGGRDNLSKTPALWSWHLAFSHPITGERVEAVSPPPSEKYPWGLWAAAAFACCEDK